MTAAVSSDFAPAKINLTLRIRGRRADGYHELESLVVFADVGDALTFTPGERLGLSVEGETAAEAGDIDGNLVLKAARALQKQHESLRGGHFHLTKSLPVAAGLGGGSSDAAAALRLLAKINDLPLTDDRLLAAARATGADVPVCLDPRPRIMRGIGDLLSGPLNLPQLHGVLVNPRVAVPTARVFAARADDSVMREPPAAVQDPASQLVELTQAPTMDALVAAVSQSTNDLEAPAIALFPAVGEVLDAIRAAEHCLLTRMSGSGGTCFGLFESATAAKAAADRLLRAHPGWWVRSTTLGAAPITRS
ncbi:4-(cytidine 5'-diphospho)-2-C-methyl-D-erythritol kinase [Pseudorhodoplanes sinuspersici]|uniref:4-(cytidine 5'-diphospho)-2-C-methyl-D-erythritol kinase n=1 Tax=Pseudorhodoplanes sinuspersici TaxID=1235591 RepID=UPI000FF28D6C|nr:4-(cytidine 5'-diphospho)-2-C-methyl-D-erythritol kinase [Pseudorhodoplanes sinuspersici]RKE70546.1 4-diphosphocytidyl-2-C-methyl-D-erythritol kinase [Pseudorhodoplanes sinuspersici]